MQFHEILRELRECREPKMTQADLAEIMKTTQRKISRLETGQAEPSLEDFRFLCHFYHVSADYLLGLEHGLPYPTR